jgi:hypothetical protein
MKRGTSGSVFQTPACKLSVLASVPGMFDPTRPDDMLNGFVGRKPNNEAFLRKTGIS